MSIACVNNLNSCSYFSNQYNIKNYVGFEIIYLREILPYISKWTEINLISYLFINDEYSLVSLF